MITRQHYSKAFKEAMVLKVLNRGDQTVSAICQKEGLSGSTVHTWLEKHDALKIMKNSNRTWSPQEKLEALLKTQNISEADLGVYLRQEGLHEHRLKEWHTEVLKSLDEALNKPQRPKKDERDVKIAGLERDLLRKDRALAEASALLILQKKVHLIWERNEEGKK